MLSLLLWLPIVGALLCLVLPAGRPTRLAGLPFSGLPLLIAATVWLGGQARSGVALEERVSWVPSLGVEYHLGLDGLSLPLVTLNGLLALIAIGASGDLSGRRGYTALLLVAEGAVMGALLALDLALFFIFYEAMLLPVVLLVGVYGRGMTGSERESGERVAAVIKFFLYTSAGSLLMLLAIIALPFAVDGQARAPLDVLALRDARIPYEAQLALFAGFAVAFAIKMPLFPFHTWLPGVYEAAPLPALAFTTMLTKVGAYGFLRIVLPILPDAAVTFAPLMAALSIAGILYAGALAATATNLVRVLAYSSIAHLGFIGLGIWSLRPEGAQGAVLQMVNHGITAAALFLLAAYLLRRTGTLELDRLGGLGDRLPVLGGLMLLVTLSSLGLPGLNNFVGEFLVLRSAYAAEPLYALALGGALLAAVYGIRYYRLIFQGRERTELTGGRDLRGGELVLLLPLVALIVLLGLYPRPVLDSARQGVESAVERVAVVVEDGSEGGAPWR